MIAAPNDFSDKPNAPALDAFTAAQKPQTPAPQLPDAVPFDAAIGKQVAQQVIARGVRSRLEAKGLGVDAAIVATEPEEIGAAGSGLRRCIVTGDVLPRDQMIRFGIAPDGTVTPDLEEQLPGRGYWVTATRTVLQQAVTADAFTRAARGPVTVAPALADQVEVLARRACMHTIGLARRAWACDFGAEAVRQALVARKAGVVLIANTAPEDVQHKLDNARGDVPTLLLFNTTELSAALGRESLAFASVNKGQWTIRLLAEAARLARLINV